MSRRRDIRPPLEVMRATLKAGSSGGRAGDGPLSVAPSTGQRDAGQGRPPQGDNWARLKQPMILRLPPGYAALIAVGVLLLLVVAYSAGYSRGGSSMASQLKADQQNELNMANRMSGNSPTLTQPEGVLGQNATAGNQNPLSGNTFQSANARVFDDVSMDPRKPGYQYYILAHCSREEAQRLVDFFAERRVEAAAVISHNRRSQYVVFLLASFTSEQTASAEARELKQKIFDWGKIWASRAYRGPTNLSDTYMALYSPKSN